MNTSVSKAELRKIYLEKRKKLALSEVESYSREIVNCFLSSFKLMENQKVHTFLPIEKFNEINTQHLIDFFWKNKIKVFVPKVMGNHMLSVELRPDTVLVKNSWGILEPQVHKNVEIKDFDFIITPLLYCDNQGNRVGYGKGFYDRFFLSAGSNALKVGFNYFPPNEQISDVSGSDIPLDYLVTRDEVFSFSLKSKSIK
ncbi:MAG: 5-formyltetrahydrofolate cyclo-ligase [Cloacibacterium sp.]|nr:5-formyltetrahydrofolate cyclo-ligase [Cloacibacterium sp.]